MSRFDYVAYDKEAVDQQDTAKMYCETIESSVLNCLPDSRAKSLALTKLEECYMWIGKAIRDEQLKRNMP